MVHIQFVFFMRNYLQETFNSLNFFYNNNRTHIEYIFFLIYITKKKNTAYRLNILWCNINSAWKVYISILYVVRVHE